MKNTAASPRDVYAQARPFALTLLLVTTALTITLAGVRPIADIIGPVFLAVVITVTLHSIRLWLEGHGLPEWAASILMLLAACLLLFLLTLALIVSVAQPAALIPQYTDQLNDALTSAGNALLDLGVKQDQIDAVTTAVDPGQIVDLAMSVLSATLGVIGDLFFLVTVLFMAFDTDFPNGPPRS